MAGKFASLASLRNSQENSSSALKDEGRAAVPIETKDRPGPAKSPSRGQGPGRPTGKRSNPDYEQTTVFLKKDTKRAAIRLLEDTGQKPDLSDLLQSLLVKHISAKA